MQKNRLNLYHNIFGTNRAAAARRLVELLPRMKSETPELEPYLLATVVTFQVDTNAPVVAEFQWKLAQINKHPNQILAPDQFWNLLRTGIYNWSIQHKLYALAAQAIEGKLQAAASGDVFLNVNREQDSIALAYAYLGMEQWEPALAVFESFSNRPVEMLSNGPWGRGLTPVLTGKEAAYCRQKLGLPDARNSLEFSMGKPVLSLLNASPIIADASGLWIGTGSRLLHLDFDLNTNLVVNLPMNSSVPITALCLTSSSIWIGTGGDGLIEFDKVSRQCRPLTDRDGLMMNDISSLHLAGDVLWIGYGQGLGLLDLSANRFSSFTLSLQEGSDVHRNMLPEATDKPTRRRVATIAGGTANDIWFLTDDPAPRLHKYRRQENLWEGFQQACTTLAGDPERLVVGQYVSPGLSILNFKNGQWRSLKLDNLLTLTAVTTLTLDGDNLWVGGMGYIALVDPAQDKVRKFAYVQASSVDRIQIGGGYVWAQFDWHLYRAALSGL